MTLTEQWKKGELPEDAYYVTYYKNDTPEVDIYRRVYSLYDDSEVRFTIPQVDKVLAPVPSYREYNRLKEVERKKGKLVNVNYKIKQENQQLKKLLKECGKQLYEYSDVCLQEGYELEREEVLKLKTKIDNAIGEKK